MFSPTRRLRAERTMSAGTQNARFVFVLAFSAGMPDGRVQRVSGLRAACARREAAAHRR